MSMDRASGDNALAEAMAWLLRLQATPQDSALRAEWTAWQAQDPANRHAWQQAEQTWALLGEVPPAFAARWEAPGLPPCRVKRPLRRRRLVLGGAAVAASALLAITWPGARGWWPQEQATGTAETRRLVLADGTTVHLAPQSAIAVDDTPSDRRVALLRGEAFFEVTPDSARRFIVIAAGLEVTVIGTAFDVRLSEAQLDVAVQHGRVHLAYAAATPPMVAELGGGERMTIRRTDGTARRGRLPPAEVAAWRDGLLFVEDTTVAEVVETLRDYHPGWVVLRDPGLAARRVTGIYDLRDIGRALAALMQPTGGQVRTLTPLVFILTAGA
jgi:transmembrane sensor